MKITPLSLPEFMAKYSAPKEHYTIYLRQNRRIHHYNGSFKKFYKSQMAT